MILNAKRAKNQISDLTKETNPYYNMQTLVLFFIFAFLPFAFNISSITADYDPYRVVSLIYFFASVFITFGKNIHIILSRKNMFELMRNLKFNLFEWDLVIMFEMLLVQLGLYVSFFCVNSLLYKSIPLEYNWLLLYALKLCNMGLFFMIYLNFTAKNPISVKIGSKLSYILRVLPYVIFITFFQQIIKEEVIIGSFMESSFRVLVPLMIMLIADYIICMFGGAGNAKFSN